jgi:hypothetical protein
MRTNPLIDIEMAGGICPSRLERALSLSVTPLDDTPQRYEITGGAEPHFVDLADPLSPRCDCGDHLWRDAVCAHILAALYREADPRVLDAARQLVSSLRETLAQTERAMSTFRVRLTPALKKHVAQALGIDTAEVIYQKHPTTTTPGATVLHAPTGEVLGRITTARPNVLFEPSAH